MIEWFSNIWQYIVDNKDNVLGFVTSIDFSATIAAILLFIRQRKSLNKHTLSIDRFNDVASKTSNVESDVKDIKELLNKNIDDVHSCQDEVDEGLKAINDISKLFGDFVLNTEAKFNALLEVQQMVYSTIRDDGIRNAVQSVIANARCDSTDYKTKLLKEIDCLKNTLESKAAEVQEVLADVEGMANKIVKNDVSEVVDYAADSNKSVVRY